MIRTHLSFAKTLPLLTCLGMASCHSDNAGTVDAQASETHALDGAAWTNGGDSDTLAAKGEFSFFAMSLKFIKSKAPCSGADKATCVGGFGGDLRNGKANGIDGADSLCEEAANLANPGDKHRWRAFLSAGNYNGAVLNAIDRIGTGPWYSAPPQYQNKSDYASEGLLFANDKSGLLKVRPDGDTTTIVYNGINQSMGAGNAQPWPFSQCLLNEYGYCTQADADTHDTLTGTKSDGTYAGSPSATCDDWTNNTKGYGAPAYGHTWPRQLNATDGAANWINIGERLSACGAIINVSTTNYGSGTNDPGAGDGGMPGGPGMDPMGDGGMGPGGGPSDIPPGGMFLADGGMGPGGMGPGDMPQGGFPPSFPDGGMGPGGMGPADMPQGGFSPSFPDGGMGGSTGGGNMGADPVDDTYAGGVGSSGGYGAFYCFAYITGAE
jgi:hypothetical protein